MSVVLNGRKDDTIESGASALAQSRIIHWCAGAAIICGVMACTTVASSLIERALADQSQHPTGLIPHPGLVTFAPNGPPGGCDRSGTPTLQSTAQSVTVCWTDNSSNEQSFALYKRTLSGGWQSIYQVATKNAWGNTDTYTYTDSDHSISGQCYKVAAVNAAGSKESYEACTVRPDPSAFPQSVSLEDKQWEGLNNTNDGTGPLYSHPRNSYLINKNQTFGVNLDWTSDASKSLWKIEAQGGPHLMYGQAVALRVWGGGWLKQGNESWGIDLALSDTPAYQWYVIGGVPGNPIQYSVTDINQFGLWNSASRRFLKSGGGTYGSKLTWDGSAPSIHTSTVWLTATPNGAGGWTSYSASFGGGVGNTSRLLQVSNPNSNLTLLFVKPTLDNGTQNCGDPNAVVTLKSNTAMAPGDMTTLFESAMPGLSVAVPFLACVVQSGGGQSTIDRVAINVEWEG